MQLEMGRPAAGGVDRFEVPHPLLHCTCSQASTPCHVRRPWIHPPPSQYVEYMLLRIGIGGGARQRRWQRRGLPRGRPVRGKKRRIMINKQTSGQVAGASSWRGVAAADDGACVLGQCLDRVCLRSVKFLKRHFYMFEVLNID